MLFLFSKDLHSFVSWISSRHYNNTCRTRSIRFSVINTVTLLGSNLRVGVLSDIFTGPLHAAGECFALRYATLRQTWKSNACAKYTKRYFPLPNMPNQTFVVRQVGSASILTTGVNYCISGRLRRKWPTHNWSRSGFLRTIRSRVSDTYSGLASTTAPTSKWSCRPEVC